MTLQWNVTMNSNASINGSCMATGNPRPLLMVTVQSQVYCDYQTNTIITNRYTTKVEFEVTLNSRNSTCQVNIYCFALNYPQLPPDKKTLNITIGEVS